MSENGPYNQPPQNPYGGGTGGQPGYGQGPYQGGPGQDQGMYAGGQPPYGVPGGPGGPGGYPPPPPQGGGGGSKAGLWVVIGGGVIIVVLVIAVIVMLATRGNNGEEVATGPDDTTQGTEETDEPVDDGTEEPATGGGDGPAGEPPYALPVEPCEVITDQVSADFNLRDDPSKSVSDNRSNCTATGNAPDGNPERAYSSLSLAYTVPYGGSDSIEGATSDLQDSLANYTGGSDYYPEANLEEDKEIDGLGDEAHLVITENIILDDPAPTAIMLVRSANMNIELTYQVSSFDGSDLTMIDDVEALLTTTAEAAIAQLGAE